MTIDTSFTAYSVTALRLSISPTLAPGARQGSAPPSIADRVTLSPDASVAETQATTPAGERAPEGVAPLSPPASDIRTTTLLSALDGDGDGSVTKQEFTAAASALLRREAPARANDDGRGRRGVPGLERRLEKAFERMDGSRDGSLSAAELTRALAGRQERAEEAAAEGPAATASITFVQVRYASIAVQRYSAFLPVSQSSSSDSTEPSRQADTMGRHLLATSDATTTEA